VRLSIPHIPVLKSYPKGNDPAAAYPDVGLTLTYWDLWCLLTAQERFGGDLSALRDALVDKRRNGRLHSYQETIIEDLIALLHDLIARLHGAPSVDEILRDFPERLLKKEAQKAIRNILEVRGYYPPSEPMLRSPRRLLLKEAMRGMWAELPIDPTPIADRLLPLFIPKKDVGYFPKGASFALTRRLEKAVAKELAMAETVLNHRAYRYAVYRAALTLYHEKNNWDDSYGEMGHLGQEWVTECLTMTADDINVGTDIFLKDLLMFLCWEDYGLSDTEDVIDYIRRLDASDRELAAAILNDVKTRADEGFQKYKTETAGRFLAGIEVKLTPRLELVRSPTPAP